MYESDLILVFYFVDPDVVAEVLAMHESEDLPSLVLPVTGPPQEPNIDLSTVFNDFFTGTFLC